MARRVTVMSVQGREQNGPGFVSIETRPVLNDAVGNAATAYQR